MSHPKLVCSWFWIHCTCSRFQDHFEQSQFEEIARSPAGGKKLKPNAIPTLFSFGDPLYPAVTASYTLLPLKPEPGIWMWSLICIFSHKNPGQIFVSVSLNQVVVHWDASWQMSLLTFHIKNWWACSGTCETVYIFTKRLSLHQPFVGSQCQKKRVKEEEQTI